MFFLFVFLLADGSLDGEGLVAEGGSVDILDGLLDGGVVFEADEGVVLAVHAELGDLAGGLEEVTDLSAGGHLGEDGSDEDGDGTSVLVSGGGSLGAGDLDGASVDDLLVEGSDGLGSGGVGVEPDEGILEAAEADGGDGAGGAEDVLDVSDGFLSETLDVDTGAGDLGGGGDGGGGGLGGGLGSGGSSLGGGSLGSGGLSGGLGGGLSSGFGGGLWGHC